MVRGEEEDEEGMEDERLGAVRRMMVTVWVEG